jgi:predicted SprT family Zn-dependent metalloprotease
MPKARLTKPVAITPVEYGGLQAGYEFFSAELFDGALPNLFITYQRRAGSAGYFAPERFSARTDVGTQHELALNPDGFLGQTDEQICQTLVHEMCHVWQQHCGKPPSRGYHNCEWADKMKSIGLQPSSTGMVGGKETGQKMSDYVIPGGRFTQAFAKLAASGWRLNLQSAHRAGAKGGGDSKTKFTCRACGASVWSKPSTQVICAICYPGSPLMEPDAAAKPARVAGVDFPTSQPM